MENRRKEKRPTLRPTSHQIDLLVNYMATHANFANGEFGGPMGAQNNLQQWKELKSLLDKNGPIRSIDQWRTTWRDKKRRAREEGAKINLTRRQTGNLTHIPEISDQSSAILGVIGHASATGLEAEEETGIGQAMVITNSGNAEAAEVVVEETNYEEELNEVLNQQPATSTQVPTAPARHNKLRPADFLQAEESTREVLKEIRNALHMQNNIAEHQNRQRRLKRLDATKRRPFQF